MKCVTTTGIYFVTVHYLFNLLSFLTIKQKIPHKAREFFGIGCSQLVAGKQSDSDCDPALENNVGNADLNTDLSTFLF